LQYSFFEPESPDALGQQMALSGHGLPREEMCGVLLAMKQLGGDADKKVMALRFFGKFWALRGMYYVFECQMAQRPEKVRSPSEYLLQATHSSTCGSRTVSCTIFKHVQEEKEVASEHLVAPEDQTGCNRYNYYICTSLGGPFVLLDDVSPEQIQAARVVSHATILCPKGAFVAPEGDEDGIAEPERNEDYKSMQVAAMRDPANWCHRCEGLQS
jgi:Radial spokehead-like protein